MAANPAKAGEELDTLCVGLRPRGFMRMAGTSRMNREAHVRFCGGLEVKFLRSTRLSGFDSHDFTVVLSMCMRPKSHVNTDV